MRRKASSGGASFGLTRQGVPALNPFSTGRTVQRLGAIFEAHVRHAARMERLLLVEHGLKAKRLRDRVVGVKSDLDYFCCGDARRGELLLFDAKSFQGARFSQSMLTAHQRDQAIRYAEHGLLAGFLVHLRALNWVGFFHARLLMRARGGFGPADGLELGTMQQFSLRHCWSSAGLGRLA